MQLNSLNITFIIFLCGLLHTSKSFQKLGNKIFEMVREKGLVKRNPNVQEELCPFPPDQATGTVDKNQSQQRGRALTCRWKANAAAGEAVGGGCVNQPHLIPRTLS